MPWSDGIGTYTKRDGTKINHADLPDDVKKEVEILGAQRNLMKQAGAHVSQNERERGAYVAKQNEINALYDPDTRPAAMEDIRVKRFVNEITERLARRK